jgi:hypothetical protein
MKVLTWLGSGEGFPLGLNTATFMLCVHIAKNVGGGQRKSSLVCVCLSLSFFFPVALKLELRVSCLAHYHLSHTSSLFCSVYF